MHTFRTSILLLLLIMVFNACSTNKPSSDWLTDSSSAYPTHSWITALGSGDTAQEASDQAFSNLSRVFKMDIYSERISRSMFNEYLEDNATGFDEKYSLEQRTDIRSELRLLNARILENKTISGNKYYALAGLNRLESAQLYESEMAKISSKIESDIKAFYKQENSFEKLRLWKKMDLEVGLLESFESQLRVLSTNKNALLNYETQIKAVDDIGRSVRPLMVLHIQTDVSETIKNEVLNSYEKMGFTYNPSATNPMLVLDVSYNQSKALVERLDAIFFNWTITIKHLDPTDKNRFKTFSITDRSGSTNETNAKARLEMDIKRRLNERLPNFIETSLLVLSTN